MPSWCAPSIRLEPGFTAGGSSLTKPLYAELAEDLKRQITQGEYRIGAALPSEVALSSQHGVSRFTARAALATLQREGYVTRRQRIGSIVVAHSPAATYSVKTNSAGDLLRFSGATDLHVIADEEFNATLPQAHELGCELNEPWIKVSTYRTSPDTGTSVSWTDFFLRPEHRDALPLIGKKRASMRQVLDNIQTRPVRSMEQKIEACALPKPMAQVLGVAAKSPALRVVYRIFSDGDNDRFYVAISYYPAGRFCLSQTLLREH
jgi:DNA-binding GntR family transcriptional regulator